MQVMAAGVGDGDAPERMVLAGREEPVGLAFAELEGYLRLSTSAIHAGTTPHAAGQHVREVASTDAGVRAIISLPLIVATIRNRIRQAEPATETST